MCGSVMRSVNAAQASDYAIAYAKSFEAEESSGAPFQRWGDPLPDSSQRLKLAHDFVKTYTPAAQRDEAHRRLDAVNTLGTLDTTLRYFLNVVE